MKATHMTMLYMNGSTHEESLVEVEPLDIPGKYREGIKAFKRVGEFERLEAGIRELGVYFDENTILDGRNGHGLILTDEQVATLRAKTTELRGARQASYVTPTAIQTGAACYSCGQPRTGRGDCPHCGADAI